MQNVQVVPRNVSLYPEDWAVVRQAAKDTGQRSMSGGLRFIIADWTRRVSNERAANDDNGQDKEQPQ